MHINRKMLTVLAVGTMTAAVVVGPQVGGAATKKKSRPFTQTFKGNKPGSLEDISGKLSSPQLGKGKQTGTLKLPTSFWKWKYKGGTLVATGVGAIKATTATGTWKITKGKSTGKFKGATGKGTFKGDIVTSVLKFKGTLKY